MNSTTAVATFSGSLVTARRDAVVHAIPEPLSLTDPRSDEGWGLDTDPGSLFGPTIVRWYPAVQWFDGDGFADLLRSTSLYRALDSHVRDPLLDAIAERIRTQMGNRVPRRYLSVLRVGRRAG